MLARILVGAVILAAAASGWSQPVIVNGNFEADGAQQLEIEFLVGDLRPVGDVQLSAQGLKDLFLRNHLLVDQDLADPSTPFLLDGEGAFERILV